MADLHSTAVLRSVVETLTVDVMILIDEVESYFDDGEAAPSEGFAESKSAVEPAGFVLSSWLSRMMDELMRCIAQAEVDPERSDLATDFAADWGHTARPAPARALGDAALVLFSRWDRLHGDWTLETRMSSPARHLQHELAARLASAAQRWAA